MIFSKKNVAKQKKNVKNNQFLGEEANPCMELAKSCLTETSLIPILSPQSAHPLQNQIDQPIELPEQLPVDSNKATESASTTSVTKVPAEPPQSNQRSIEATTNQSGDVVDEDKKSLPARQNLLFQMLQYNPFQTIHQIQVNDAKNKATPTDTAHQQAQPASIGLAPKPILAKGADIAKTFEIGKTSEQEKAAVEFKSNDLDKVIRTLKIREMTDVFSFNKQKINVLQQQLEREKQMRVKEQEALKLKIAILEEKSKKREGISDFFFCEFCEFTLSTCFFSRWIAKPYDSQTEFI